MRIFSMSDRTDFQPGTRIRTLYQHSFTGTIVKPRAANLPLPGPDWFIVRIDGPVYPGSSGKLCINRSMLALSNEGKSP
jgi:hypothetical protein